MSSRTSSTQLKHREHLASLSLTPCPFLWCRKFCVFFSLSFAECPVLLAEATRYSTSRCKILDPVQRRRPALTVFKIKISCGGSNDADGVGWEGCYFAWTLHTRDAFYVAAGLW